MITQLLQPPHSRTHTLSPNPKFPLSSIHAPYNPHKMVGIAGKFTILARDKLLAVHVSIRGSCRRADNHFEFLILNVPGDLDCSKPCGPTVQRMRPFLGE